MTRIASAGLCSSDVLRGGTHAATDASVSTIGSELAFHQLTLTGWQRFSTCRARMNAVVDVPRLRQR
jgi:hypothetical protein